MLISYWSSDLCASDLRIMRDAVPYMRGLPDPLPEWIRTRHDLVSYAEALETLHFPPDRAALSAAKRRLAYQEVFELILASLYIKKEIATETAVEVPFGEALAREFVGHLPFKQIGRASCRERVCQYL